jgi:membrane-associated protease RseP (regulator of RpoE activity)
VGTPLSLKQRATMQQIGLALLLLLIILVTYNDLLRTIQ